MSITNYLSTEFKFYHKNEKLLLNEVVDPENKLKNLEWLKDNKNFVKSVPFMSSFKKLMKDPSSEKVNQFYKDFELYRKGEKKLQQDLALKFPRQHYECGMSTASEIVEKAVDSIDSIDLLSLCGVLSLNMKDDTRHQLIYARISDLLTLPNQEIVKILCPPKYTFSHFPDYEIMELFLNRLDTLTYKELFQVLTYGFVPPIHDFLIFPLIFPILLKFSNQELSSFLNLKDQCVDSCRKEKPLMRLESKLIDEYLPILMHRFSFEEVRDFVGSTDFLLINIMKKKELYSPRALGKVAGCIECEGSDKKILESTVFDDKFDDLIEFLSTPWKSTSLLSGLLQKQKNIEILDHKYDSNQLTRIFSITYEKGQLCFINKPTIEALIPYFRFLYNHKPQLLKDILLVKDETGLCVFDYYIGFNPDSLSFLPDDFFFDILIQTSALGYVDTFISLKNRLLKASSETRFNVLKTPVNGKHIPFDYKNIRDAAQEVMEALTPEQYNYFSQKLSST